MGKLCLVTGANGHLGNTLVRTLLARGEQVRAGVRDTANHTAFAGLNCELVYTELQNKDSLRKALEGVEILYQVAAVFRHWARDPQTEIIAPNVNGTRNIMQAAAEAGVKKVVYVSSIAAIGHNGHALNETSWNDERDNAYYRSKILAEQVAWEVAQELHINMVAVLPSAMIGPNAQHLTDTMAFLDDIARKRVPLNPGFYFNFVDVRDVAEGLVQAAEKGRRGERYILAKNILHPCKH